VDDAATAGRAGRARVELRGLREGVHAAKPWIFVVGGFGGRGWFYGAANADGVSPSVTGDDVGPRHGRIISSCDLESSTSNLGFSVAPREVG
jgi:hypothetical protein